jgi:hypothetical protein
MFACCALVTIAACRAFATPAPGITANRVEKEDTMSNAEEGQAVQPTGRPGVTRLRLAMLIIVAGLLTLGPKISTAENPAHTGKISWSESTHAEIAQIPLTAAMEAA